jgi:hypothetical protein
MASLSPWVLGHTTLEGVSKDTYKEGNKYSRAVYSLLLWNFFHMIESYNAINFILQKNILLHRQVFMISENFGKHFQTIISDLG